MKKWLTIDDVVCSFLSAVAYGFGYSIPSALNAPGWLCLVICFALGMFAESFSAKIIYSKFVQEKPSRRLIVSLLYVAFFIVCNAISNTLLKSSLVGGLEEQIITVAAFAFLGFIVSIVTKYFRYLKVKDRYGDNEEGYKLNGEEKNYMRSLDKQNKEIIGEYDTNLAVKTRNGIYVGQQDGDLIVFCGIPYAKPPVGSLRFKAPVKLEDSNKVYEAKHFGPSAIQVNYKGNPLAFHNQSEDCLYLNVCTRSLNTNDKKPVVVYLHGGDYTFGGSADPQWETQNFAKANDGIITVTFNYRLGLLGYIDLKDVPGGEQYKDSDNLGILDQIAALEWICENIEQFGGNPKDITLMGDGSGGLSISLLGACSKANTLFNKAIILSGNPFCLDICNGDTSLLAKELLKEAKASNMDDLLALSEKEISELTQKLKGYLLAPKCDGRLIPKDVIEAYKNGAGKNIHFITCMCRDNINSYASSIGRSFSKSIVEETINNLLACVNPSVSIKFKQLLDEYIAKMGKEKALFKFYNDLIDNLGQYKLSEAIYNGSGMVHILYWDVEPAIEKFGAGATHIANTILNNKEATVVHGNVVDYNIQEILNCFIMKAINDNKLELYNNEIVGVDKIKWEGFPKVMEIKDKIISIKSIDDVVIDLEDALDN